MSQLDNSGQVSPTPPLTTLLSGPQSRVIGDKTLQNQSVWKSETMKQTRWCSNIPVLSIYKLIDCLCIRWGEVGLKLETKEKDFICYSHTTHQSSHLSGYSEIEIRPRKCGGARIMLPPCPSPPPASSHAYSYQALLVTSHKIFSKSVKNNSKILSMWFLVSAAQAGWAGDREWVGGFKFWYSFSSIFTMFRKGALYKLSIKPRR